LNNNLLFEKKKQKMIFFQSMPNLNFAELILKKAQNNNTKEKA